MPHIKLVISGIVFAHSIYTERNNLKLIKCARDLAESNTHLYKVIEAQDAQLTYLTSLLCENDVPCTEFDMIAMKAMLPED